VIPDSRRFRAMSPLESGSRRWIPVDQSFVKLAARFRESRDESVTDPERNLRMHTSRTSTYNESSVVHRSRL